VTDYTHDIIIVGGGTAGLVTAAGAAALGAKAALIERAALGGECLWTGCVPSKALIAFARKYRDGGGGTGDGSPHYPSPVPRPPSPWPQAVAWLRSARDRIAPHDSPERFRSLGVDVLLSPARLAGPERVEINDRVLRARRIVLAMGSGLATPPIPGLAAAGFLTHVTALDQTRIPPHIAILGAGPTGMEFAQTYRRLGAAVTVLEMAAEVLPKEDPEAGRCIRACLEAEGIAVLTGFHATEVQRDGTSKVVIAEDGRRVAADELFVATGRRPNARDAEPERAGVELDDGAVRVSPRLETTARGVWAAGDVTGGPQFTPVAEHMAKVVVQNALTPIPTKADYRVVPSVTFTDPELARVGLTLDEAVTAGERAEVHRAEFSDLDRAIVEGATAGFCKVVTRKNGTILGATIVGRGAGELIMELALAMRHGIPLGRLARAIHPYPTMGEIVKRTADSWYRTRYGATSRGRLLRRFIRWWL
jgi:pyruvate/2-oxoglutarate dehydrogenase complex dihydrolipoamide dehydrogenase (E3) component